MSRRKGDSYLGGHTIWPSFGPSPFENDLAEKKRRKEKQLNRAWKAQQKQKKRRLATAKNEPKIKEISIPQKSPTELRLEALKEIGFDTRLGKIYISNLAQAIRQGYLAGFKSSSEICSHFNEIEFYTVNGSKWSIELVEIDRNELRQRRIWDSLGDLEPNRDTAPVKKKSMARKVLTKLTGRILTSQPNRKKS